MPKRLKKIRETLDHMLEDSEIGESAHGHLMMLLNPNEANDSLHFMSETNVKPPDVKVWRTEIPDEITAPISDDKRGPEHIHEPLDELTHALALGHEPAFEPEPAVEPAFEPKPLFRSPKPEELIYMPSKKAKKAKIMKKSIEWDELQNRIKAIHEDKPRNLDEDWTGIEKMNNNNSEMGEDAANVWPEDRVKVEEKAEVRMDDFVDDEPLADGLDFQPAAEFEPASAAPDPESAGYDQEVATKEHADDHAYLFSRCIKCKRSDWATIGEKSVPISLVPDGKDYEAAFLMVMCGSCSKLRAPKNAQRFGFGGLDECTDMFRSMEMNKDLMEESKAYKAASIIAGKKVHVIGRIGELVYVEMNRVMKALTPADTMVSLDLDHVDSGNRNRIVLKHLKQGLV